MWRYFKITMGHGSKGPIEQSQMKPKTKSRKERRGGKWMRFITLREDEKISILPEDTLDSMKRLNTGTAC